MDAYANRVKQQRDHCLHRINQIEGLEVEQPGGAFYMFIRLTDEMWANDDKSFVLKLLLSGQDLRDHQRPRFLVRQ